MAEVGDVSLTRADYEIFVGNISHGQNNRGGAAVMGLLMWPLHPIGYVVSGTWILNSIWFSIFLAWMIKSIVLKYMGPGGYRSTRWFF